MRSRALFCTRLVAKVTQSDPQQLTVTQGDKSFFHKESEEGKAQLQREGANKMGEDDQHEDNRDETMTMMTVKMMMTMESKANEMGHHCQLYIFLVICQLIITL